jgi:Xaa-Pro dipeptidase
MTIANDLLSKIEKLKNLYRTKEKSAILLGFQNNISWLLRGRTFVNIAAVKGVAEIVVNADGLFVICNNVEAKRLAEEEFPSGITILSYDWFLPVERDKIIAELTANNYISDSDCENELRNLRIIMTENEQETYILLGKDCAEAMQKTCFSVKQEMSELQISGILAANCIEAGIEPIVNLVAADERIFLHRHPLPTVKTLKNYAMLVLCGRRFGQVISITRFISFGEPSAEIIKKRDAVQNLDALLFIETRPNAVIGDIFAKLVKGYEHEGYADEWKLHHQGGLTGYDSREVKANFETGLIVKAGQVYAWNPSITGYKSEDTFLVGETENLILTETDKFPHRKFTFNGIEFEKADILRLK